MTETTTLTDRITERLDEWQSMTDRMAQDAGTWIYPPDVPPIVLPDLIAALRAILALHPSKGTDSEPCCETCWDGANGSDSADWPCPTVLAVAHALGVTP